MELFPLYICSLNNRFHILQPIVRIGRWDCACVGFLIITSGQSLLPLRDENPVVAAKMLLAMAGLYGVVGFTTFACLRRLERGMAVHLER